MFHLILPRTAPPSSPLKVGLHSPPPQTATSLHDVATRGPCQVPPTGLGRRARTKLVPLLMAGGPVHHGRSASLQIPGGATRRCILVSCFIFRGRSCGVQGGMARWIVQYSSRCASPFSGVFWVPEGGIPHWRWTLDAGDGRGGPISAWCFCCCFQRPPPQRRRRTVRWCLRDAVSMSRAWVSPGVEEGSESFAEARTKGHASSFANFTNNATRRRRLRPCEQGPKGCCLRGTTPRRHHPATTPLPSARMGIRDGAANNMPMPTQQEETPMSAPAAMEQPNARTAFLRRRGGNAETLRWEPRGWKLGPKAPRQQNRTMAAWYPSLINDPWLGSRLLQQPRRKGLEIWWTLWPWKGRRT